MWLFQSPVQWYVNENHGHPVTLLYIQSTELKLPLSTATGNLCISQIIPLHAPYTACIFMQFTSCDKVASSACHVFSITHEPQLTNHNTTTQSQGSAQHIPHTKVNTAVRLGGSGQWHRKKNWFSLNLGVKCPLQPQGKNTSVRWKTQHETASPT